MVTGTRTRVGQDLIDKSPVVALCVPISPRGAGRMRWRLGARGSTVRVEPPSVQLAPSPVLTRWMRLIPGAAKNALACQPPLSRVTRIFFASRWTTRPARSVWTCWAGVANLSGSECDGASGRRHGKARSTDFCVVMGLELEDTGAAMRVNCPPSQACSWCPRGTGRESEAGRFRLGQRGHHESWTPPVIVL